MSDQRDREQRRRDARRSVRQNVARARQKLLAQHRRLTAERERSGDRTEGAGAESPTVPDARDTDAVSTGRHSTVPSRPRKSGQRPHDRIYGHRFKRTRENGDSAQ